jgi:hypothetical protein
VRFLQNQILGPQLLDSRNLRFGAVLRQESDESGAEPVLGFGTAVFDVITRALAGG